MMAGQADPDTSSTKKPRSAYAFTFKKCIVPTVFLTYGIIGYESDAMKIVNQEVQEESQENIDEKVSIDDFLQYAPALAVYSLNAMGIEGKFQLGDELKINAISLLIMGTVVTSMKYSFKVVRPDNSTENSFPSGHTAMAFANAEFLFQEYRDQNTWLAASGYAVAAFVGGFRISNNRHWVTDVVSGAGIGILSTKAAYWIYDSHLIRKSESVKHHAMAAPYYNSNSKGLTVSLVF
jgi:hypothetical protein